MTTMDTKEKTSISETAMALSDRLQAHTFNWHQHYQT